MHHKNLYVHFGYDIEPECEGTTTRIIKQDYLSTDFEYLPGRLIIGNPPYGRCLSLAQKFFKKAIEQADYVAFILPISQYQNNKFLYEFDLIYSEDLGNQLYTDRELHCCFNIYRRPNNDEYNPKPKTNLKDITIYRQDSKGYDEKEFDIRMCYWGDGTAGKILSEDEHYSGEYKIKIHNEDLKAEIIEVLKNTNWNKEINSTAMLKIQQHHIISLLKREVVGIK